MGISTSVPACAEAMYYEQGLDLSKVPEELLEEILSYLPSSFILEECRKVCSHWRCLIDGHSLWKKKCLRENKVIPAITLSETPKNFYRNIYLKNPYGRNLIRNKSKALFVTPEFIAEKVKFYGTLYINLAKAFLSTQSVAIQDRIGDWIIIKNGGDQWAVENPPMGGCDPIPETDDQTCYASSYTKCSKYQLINLEKEGVPGIIMDTIKPQIVVSEWHASRPDCGTIYKLKVFLLDHKRQRIAAFRYGPYTEQQWTGRKWIQAKHVFEDYPSGVRYIFFKHSGQDTQFWAGHYGSKMAAASVRLVIKS